MKVLLVSLKKISLCLLVAGAFLSTPSCALLDKYASQRRNIKVEKKARKAEEKAYKARVKAHHDRQSDQTRAMMKQTKKKNKKFLKQFRKKAYV